MPFGVRLVCHSRTEHLRFYRAGFVTNAFRREAGLSLAASIEERDRQRLVTNAFRREAGLSLQYDFKNQLVKLPSPMPFGVRLVCHADTILAREILFKSPMPFGVRLVCHQELYELHLNRF